MKIKMDNRYSVSEWSGGKTTELFLYPPEGSYKTGDFKARVSSATVELETSVFTPLPGVYRMLMVLDGEMQLYIEGNDAIKMRPYDICAFKGELETRSAGRVRDFNLMVKDGMHGDMSFVSLEKRNKLGFIRTKGKQWIIFYVVGGEGLFNGEPIKEKDTLSIEDYNGESCDFENTGKDALKLAICRIWEN